MLRHRPVDTRIQCRVGKLLCARIGLSLPRRLSFSNEKPALQLEATLSHDSGFYAGAFAATIEAYGIDADGDGARAEVDITGGFAFSRAGFNIDASATGYFYPDASDVTRRTSVDLLDSALSAARPFGSARIDRRFGE